MATKLPQARQMILLRELVEYEFASHAPGSRHQLQLSFTSQLHEKGGQESQRK
jgi:hypothetical protein